MNALLEHKWHTSAAQDRVWVQVTGLAPMRATRRLLMALKFQAFVDDSTTPNGEFVLAGHVAPAEAWAAFAKDWEELLPLGTIAKSGKYHFKMSEMALSPAGMERVQTFYRVIEKHTAISISCRMNLEDFSRARDRVEEELRKFNITVDFQRWGNPYFFVFRALVDHFHLQRETMMGSIPLDEPVDFIFDNQTEKSFILAAWDEYIETRPDDIKQYYGATPRFEDDQQFLPLQAADLWAWWVREWYEEENTPVPAKMRAMDFGKWRGASGRFLIAFSYDEELIRNALMGMAFEHLPDAKRDGQFIFPDGKTKWSS